MHELWNNKTPPDQAPQLKSLTRTVAKKESAANTEFVVLAEATDPDSDLFTYHWTVSAESAGRDKHNREHPTKPLTKCLIKPKGPSATFRAPEKPGAYRVHLRVTDNRKRAATENFPIKVK